MTDLKLKFVLGGHAPIFKALVDGRVRPDGIELDASTMAIDELFWHLPNIDDIDVAELSLTGYMWGVQQGKEWTALPVFPGWVFGCHTDTLCNADAGIKGPEDLKGKRVGVPEYPVTAITWIRDAFETLYGVRREDIQWFEERTADYSHYRPMGYTPPDGVPVEIIPKDKRLCDMLIDGEIDAVVRYFGRPENATKTHPGDRSHIPLRALGEHPATRWLYEDRKGAAIDYYRQLGYLQPIHCIMVKKSVVEENPWVARSLMDAFAEAAEAAPDAGVVSPSSYSFPVEEQRDVIDPAFSPVGLKSNRSAVEKILELTFADGYVTRGKPFTVEEFFHASTLDT